MAGRLRQEDEVPDELREHPTVKLRQVDVARAAREADQRVVEAEQAARSAPPRKSQSIYPDIEVSVDVASLEEGAQPSASEEAGAPLESPLASANDKSVIRRAYREGEGPRLSSVPCVVASKEDLSWFQLEETSHVILAMIDGESTVGSIVDMLTIPRASTLAILRELCSHGVIEFHES